MSTKDHYRCFKSSSLGGLFSTLSEHWQDSDPVSQPMTRNLGPGHPAPDCPSTSRVKSACEYRSLSNVSLAVRASPTVINKLVPDNGHSDPSHGMGGCGKAAREMASKKKKNCSNVQKDGNNFFIPHILMGNSGSSCCNNANDDHIRTFKKANDKPDLNIFSLKADDALFLCTRQAEKSTTPSTSLSRPRRLDQIFPEANAIQAYFLEKGDGSNTKYNIIEPDMEFEVGSNVFAVLISCLHEAVDDDNLRGVKDVLGAAEKRDLHKNWINCSDPDGNTCLHKAAWRGNLNILWLILQVNWRAHQTQRFRNLICRDSLHHVVGLAVSGSRAPFEQSVGCSKTPR